MSTQHRILVVDDDSEVRDILVELLEEHGYDPVGARDGREALDELRATRSRPCLILLDLMMPGMDGRAFREEQLRSPELAKIPVVVISAYRDVMESARDLKAHGALHKPFNTGDLFTVVQQHCGCGATG
jgi:two-component system chemotaxis response regulator CheY